MALLTADAVEAVTEAIAEPIESIAQLPETMGKTVGRALDQGVNAVRNWEHEQINRLIAPAADYHTARYFRYFAWRSAVASIAFHTAKNAIKWLIARAKRPRVTAVAEYISDVVLPTNFFGPAIGVAVGMNHLKNDPKDQSAAPPPPPPVELSGGS